MFGLEILDVVVGLAFVYLLLSLLCTAVNEYIAGLTNRRGKALVAGIQKLLDDQRDDDLKDRVLNHRLIKSMYSLDRRGGERPPSYIPARTFAMALLDTIEKPAVPVARSAAAPQAGTGGATAGAGTAPTGGDPASVTRTSPQSVRDVLHLMREDAFADVSQTIPSEGVEPVEKMAVSATVPATARAQVDTRIASSRTELQKLHDSVEVWFNNSMDRVSGAYKRRTQVILWLIGLVVAIMLNADTIDMWRRLSTDDKLREGLAAQASAALPSIATLQAKDTASADTAGFAADSAAAASQSTDTASQVTDTASQTTDTAVAGANTLVPSPAVDTGAASTTDTVDTPIPTPSPTSTTGGSASGGTKDTTTSADTTFRDLAAARAVFDSTTSMLYRTQLGFGWGWEDMEKLGMARRLLPTEASERKGKVVGEIYRARLKELADTTGGKRAHAVTPVEKQQIWSEISAATPLPEYASAMSSPWKWPAILSKIMGLLLTAFALSLGAPFWFDTLNKLINIRNAGRAPDEKPKNPEAPGKRMAEQAKR